MERAGDIYLYGSPKAAPPFRVSILVTCDAESLSDILVSFDVPRNAHHLDFQGGVFTTSVKIISQLLLTERGCDLGITNTMQMDFTAHHDVEIVVLVSHILLDRISYHSIPSHAAKNVPTLGLTSKSYSLLIPASSIYIRSKTDCSQHRITFNGNSLHRYVQIGMF